MYSLHLFLDLYSIYIQTMWAICTNYIKAYTRVILVFRLFFFKKRKENIELRAIPKALSRCEEKVKFSTFDPTGDLSTQGKIK